MSEDLSSGEKEEVFLAVRIQVLALSDVNPGRTV
jgi:hypothetical protein